jgi:hypothetical protein
MDRVVFCPSMESIEEAELIAKEWSLPIQVGDSERTKGMEFDRNKVSVILIPIYSGFLPFPPVIKPMTSISFNYYDDFVDCSKLDFFLSMNNALINKTIKMNAINHDLHHCALPAFFESEGYYSISVFLESIKITEVNFVVSNGDESEIGSYA